MSNEQSQGFVAAIFDYGGVLTSSPREAFAQWAEQHRVAPASLRKVMRSWMSSTALEDNPIHLIEKGRIDDEQLNRELSKALITLEDTPLPQGAHLENLFKFITPQPLMIEALDRLRQSGIALGLLSNSWDNEYPADLLELFDVVVLSGETGLRKPDAEIFEMTLTRLGISAEQAIMIDDNKHNIDSAIALGMAGIVHISPEDTLHQLAEVFPQTNLISF
jgi:putative hydrolase of the HAD superfamily